MFVNVVLKHRKLMMHKMKMTALQKGRLLFWAMVMAGLLVPILPHLLVPLFNPQTDMGLLKEMLRRPVALTILCLWTTLPFVAIASLARLSFTHSTNNLSRQFLHFGGVIGSFTFGLITGFICHAPRTSGGVNFGVMLFPLYTLVVMPLGYLVGSIVGWIIDVLIRFKGRFSFTVKA